MYVWLSSREMYEANFVDNFSNGKECSIFDC